jgi:cytochrome c oxidase cbb3-type subunit 3
MGHADEADGIEEYDNPLPDWWLGLFWVCILWAIGYTAHYHFIADRSQEKRFQAEMAAAAEVWPAGAAPSVEFALTPEAIQAGEEVYAANCYMCHGTGLEGGIGPSFLDEEWIHGHSPEEVIAIITDGVVEKGMLAWGPILGPEKVNQVAAYVLAKNAEAVGLPLDQIGADRNEPGEGVGEEGSGGEEGQGPGMGGAPGGNGHPGAD